MKRSIIALTIFTLFGLSNTTFAQWANQTSGVTNDLNDIYFTDNNTGWIVGRQGTLLKTTNGGVNWSAQDSKTTEDLNAVFMVNANSGYAVGKKGKISKYNGTSWSAVNTGQSLDIMGVYFLNETTGWAVGKAGKLYYTSNAGGTWTNQNTDALALYTYNDIQMLDANTGWAVGSTGRIAKFNGTSWSGETSGTMEELLGVHFLNSTFGIAVGKSSTILMYDGNSWSPSNSGLGNTNDNIYDVHIVSQNEAYAVVTPSFGGAGIILKYNGSVWSKEYEFSDIGSELFYGLHFPSSSKGYAVGAGGMIKTKGSGLGIYTINTNAAIKLYPNPSVDEINLSLDNAIDATANLIDIGGRTIKEIQLNRGNNRVDISDIAKGIYYFQILDEDKRLIVTEKIVKQ